MEKEAAQQYLRTIRALGFSREQALEELASPEGKDALASLSEGLIPSQPEPIVQSTDVFVAQPEPAAPAESKPSPWDRIIDKGDPFAEDLSSPERRLGATLNVLTGTKGLTTTALAVLAAEIQDEYFHSYMKVGHKINSLLGKKFFRPGRTTQALLEDTIAPIGAAASSAEDERLWRITPFGRETVWAFLYTIQACKQINDTIGADTTSKEKEIDPKKKPVDPIDIVGSKAVRVTGITPAQMRFSILEHIVSQKKLPASQLVDNKGNALKGYLAGFVSSGLIETVTEELEDDENNISFYRIAQPYETTNIDDFSPPTEAGWAARYMKKVAPPLIQKLRELHAAQPTTTYFPVQEIVQATKNGPSGNQYRTGCGVLLELAKKGYLEHVYDLKHVAITEKGAMVMTTILDPLRQFAQDPYSVDAINSMREKGIYAHLGLMGYAAASHDRRSPDKQDVSLQQKHILGIIRVAQESGNTLSQLMTASGLSRQTVSRYARRLVASGQATCERVHTKSGIEQVFRAIN